MSWSIINTTKTHSLFVDTRIIIDQLETPDIVAPADIRISLFALLTGSNGETLADLLLHFDDPTPPIYSNEYKNRIVQLNGNATIDSAVRKFGVNGLNLSVAGSHANVTPSMLVGAVAGVEYVAPEITYQTGFTVDFWIQLASLDPVNDATILDSSGDNSAAWSSGSKGWTITIGADGSLKFNKLAQSFTLAPAGSFSTGTMDHIAIRYDGNDIWAYKNGTGFTKVTIGGIAPADRVLRIGMNSAGNNQLLGYIDELRIRTGNPEYIYGVNFSPPVQRYDSILDDHTVTWTQTKGNPVVLNGDQTAYPWFTVFTTSGDLNYEFVITIDANTLFEISSTQIVFRTPAEVLYEVPISEKTKLNSSHYNSPKRTEAATPQNVRYVSFPYQDGEYGKINWDVIPNTISNYEYRRSIIIQKFLKGYGWVNESIIPGDRGAYQPLDLSTVYRVGSIYQNLNATNFGQHVGDAFDNFSSTIISPHVINTTDAINNAGGIDTVTRIPITEPTSVLNASTTSFITFLLRTDPQQDTITQTPLFSPPVSFVNVSKTSDITFLVITDPQVDIVSKLFFWDPNISYTEGLVVTRLSGGSIGT